MAKYFFLNQKLWKLLCSQYKNKRNKQTAATTTKKKKKKEEEKNKKINLLLSLERRRSEQFQNKPVTILCLLMFLIKMFVGFLFSGTVACENIE